MDDKLNEIADSLTPAEFDIVALIKQIHDWTTLNEIVPHGQSLSSSMVVKYEAHQHQLKLYKGLIKKSDKKTAMALKQLYEQYITNKLGKDDFDSKVKNALKNSTDEDAQTILTLIEKGQFMPKQRSSANGVIPHF